MKQSLIAFPYPKIIAHRGASHDAPENTLAAFKLAKEMGALAIETDIMLTRDDVPIIMHDNSTKRTTEQSLQVGESTWSDLKHLNAGRWKNNKRFDNEAIPTLDQVLATLHDLDIAANLEIKPYQPTQVTSDVQKQITQKTATVALATVRKALAQYQQLPGIVFSSFDMDALRSLRAAQCEWPIGMLLDSWPNDVQSLLDELKPNSVHISDKIATPENVQLLKSQGYKVLVYTVDAPERAQTLYTLGVDGIFTNKPDMNIN